MATVLVTGASSGIGKALAQVFAANGHELVIVARDLTRLRETAEEIQQKYGVSCMSIAEDLSQESATANIFQRLEKEQKKIAILVNNAGHTVHGPFHATDIAQEINLVQLQIGSFLRLIKMFLVKAPKKEGLKILNVASVYSFSPVPSQSVYGAVKAFMYSFSLAIGRELRDEGVQVTLLCPGSTRTEFRRRAGIKSAKALESGMPPELVAKIAYAGLMSGKKVVVPGLINKFYFCLCRLLSAEQSANLLVRINRVRFR